MLRSLLGYAHLSAQLPVMYHTAYMTLKEDLYVLHWQST